MALITCPECGEIISDSAISCVHCGCQKLRQQPSSSKEGGGCCLGCFGVLLCLFLIGYSGILSKPKAKTRPARPAYVHTMPLITEGENSVWVYTECNVYAQPKEENPIGFVRQKASIVVQSVPVNGEYDWVKIIDGPVRPTANCKLPTEGDYIEKPKGLYLKRINLITTQPGEWGRL